MRKLPLGHLLVVQCLVEEFKADVNIGDDLGYSPLLLAVLGGHVDVVRYLGEHGADVNKKNLQGGTPVFMAVQEGQLDVLKCLVEEFGADVNEGMRTGDSPLYKAAHDGSLEMVRCLLRGKADVNRTDDKQRTALMVASYCQHTDIVKWLLKAGADAQMTASTGDTAVDASTHSYVPTSELTAYLDAKAHCSNLGCSGAGIMKCTGCKQARYCCESCQLAHWKAHKTDCKRESAALAAAGRKTENKAKQ
jgi:ankyrin repeat protein